jgi:Na+/H+ antiporter NhaD/arsenite permease-like protein
MLGCIAALPLIPAAARVWERNWVKLVVALGVGVPVALWCGLAGAGDEVGRTLVEFVQFITLLTALFVISGGICLTGDLRATPRHNTVFLAAGTVAASLIGTTGAAMLLIRPLLATNRQRAYVAHTVVFAIFTAANSGGLLTPLGDPPLFLGLLRGVPFWWTLTLWPQWLFVNGLLLLTYYALDKGIYARESPAALAADDAGRTPLGLRGGVNLIYLVIVVAAVAFVPSVDLAAGLWVPWRELVLVAATVASLLSGDRETRYQVNSFTWSPVVEVAALFLGLFLTMVPALGFLRQAAPRLPLDQVSMLVITGGLSSVLDNAPTYATFFELATRLPGEPLVAGVPEAYLVAISLGAVFGGALTYIGNGPNFMARSVAVAAGVPMPGFGGYLGWSGRYVVPVLVAMTAIFSAGGWWSVPGYVIVAGLVAHAGRRIWAARI